MAIRHGITLAILALRASASMYWVDPGCNEKMGDGQVTKMVEEAIEVAGMIRQRLQRSEAEEPIAHAAFKSLFGFGLGDTLTAGYADKFKRTIGGFPVDPAPDYLGISEWVESLDREDATARIYCDNGAGFSEVKDSKAPETEQPEYYAEADQIKAKGSKPCGKPDEGMFVARSYLGIGDGTHAEPRARITICDKYISIPSRPTTDLWQHLPSRGKLEPHEGESFLDFFSSFGSMVMLHELSHVPPYSTGDYKYRWGDSHQLWPNQAVDNADSYSLMGILVMLMEDKWMMEEGGDSAAPTLVYNKDIPGRASSRKFKRLSSGEIIG